MTDPKRRAQDPSEMQALMQPAVASSLASDVRFRAIYDDCFGYVWTILRRLGVYDRELEDAVHDVFVVFHRRLADFDETRPVKPWLAGIATRVASDFRRKAVHRRERMDDDVKATIAPAQEAELAAKQARDVVRRALSVLDMDRRAVLVLVDLEGYKVPEVAELLEVPLNTAYSRLRLARRDFAAAVKAPMEGGA